MTERYIDLSERVYQEAAGHTLRRAIIDGTLEWLDEHPDQVPGRTITESEFKHAARSNQIGDSLGCYRGFLTDLGVVTVPDPEPTNAEKIEVALTRLPWLGKDERRSIAEQLDRAGVKATTNQEKL